MDGVVFRRCTRTSEEIKVAVVGNTYCCCCRTAYGAREYKVGVLEGIKKRQGEKKPCDKIICSVRVRVWVEESVWRHLALTR